MQGEQLPVLFLAGVVLWTMAHSASASMWPNFMRELGYSKTWIGSLWGLAAFIEFPAMLVAGALSDITGTVVMLAAGGFFIGLVNTGYLLFAQYLPALLGIQVIRGFGFGSYTTSAMTFTTGFGIQRTRGRTSGLFYTMASAGQLLGSYFGGTLAQWRGFGFMYGFCTVSALVAGVCFLILRRQHR
jgi:MFS family permease